MTEIPQPSGPSPATSPQIGADEWVRRSGERMEQRTVIRRAADRVPRVVLLAAFVLVGALIPLMTSDEYVVRVAADTMLYVLLAAGLNVAVGWAGLLDLGYIAFYGFAAYFYAELSSDH